jgi:hypothetical protein
LALLIGFAIYAFSTSLGGRLFIGALQLDD